MELKYMKQLKDTPNLSSRIPLKGLEIETVIEIRKLFNEGKKFPLAFEEYLNIGGESEATGMVFEWDDFEQLREDCEESLEYTGYKMDRPYFVFDQLDGQYSIFFLDEDTEDPNVYILDPSGAYEGNEPFLKDVKYTFSKMINDAIYRRLNNIPL
ncbi:hypothetical protein V2595_05925 [Tenacibaculum maritimum]|uniref:Knr4/Smi1-like domain-containing protein n=4 Tax=Tenacibaculum maritimum TaxID=107401 RepID=A0A2H1E6Y0_9FLAO|nr:hypothetical protein [Tenacibaculum maritimum]CAA0162795.1 conserved hypothetical protein [Tenacibaculum maritimum]SFZ80518.1 conserved protein of unknown function [Tenacibaculum maritimum NCIMB 2154]